MRRYARESFSVWHALADAEHGDKVCVAVCLRIFRPTARGKKLPKGKSLCPSCAGRLRFSGVR